MNGHLAKTFFTMFDDSRKLWQRHQFKWFDQIFFFAGTSGTASAFAAGVGFFPMHPFSDEWAEPSAQPLSAALKIIRPEVQHGDFYFVLGS